MSAAYAVHVYDNGQDTTCSTTPTPCDGSTVSLSGGGTAVFQELSETPNDGKLYGLTLENANITDVVRIQLGREGGELVYGAGALFLADAKDTLVVTLRGENTLAGTWYSDAIVWAAQTQVLRSYGNGKFGPNDLVSKEMMNMVTARQAGEDPAWVGDPALAVPAPPGLRPQPCSRGMVRTKPPYLRSDPTIRNKRGSARWHSLVFFVWVSLINWNLSI